MISLSIDPSLYSVPKRNASCLTLWDIAIMQSHWDWEPIRVLHHALGLFPTCEKKDKNKRQPCGHLGPASSSTLGREPNPPERNIQHQKFIRDREQESWERKEWWSWGGESGMSVKIVDMDVCSVWHWLEKCECTERKKKHGKFLFQLKKCNSIYFMFL